MNQTKEHILRTSLILFLQKSYRDVTMSEIVAKTGLSKGAFYHYFNSKEDLFREIANMFFAFGAIDYSEFSQDSLKEFYNQYIHYVDLSFNQIYDLVGDSEEMSLNFFFIMFEAVSRFPEFMKFELDQYNKSIEAWTSVIKKAKETNEISSSLPDNDIANLFLYVTDGVFLRYVNNNIKSLYSEDLLKAFDSIYDGL